MLEVNSCKPENRVLSGMQTVHLGILASVLKTQTRIFRFCGDSLQIEDRLDRSLADHSAVKTSSIFLDELGFLTAGSFVLCLFGTAGTIQTRLYQLFHCLLIS